jgi:hypothetical protein
VVKVDAQMHKVLDLRVKPNPGAGLAPLQGGVASARVSTLGPVFTAFTVLSFHRTCDIAQGLRDGRGEP